MSIELSLFPVDSLWPGGIDGYSHTILNAPQDYKMFDDIRPLAQPLPPRHDVTAHLGTYTDNGRRYGRLDRDAYGELYTWVRADVLGPILWKRYPAHPVSAYVAALAADTMVVLDWH